MRWLSRLIVIITLAGLAGALIAGTCHAQAREADVPTDSMRTILAATYCDSTGQAAIWVDKRIVPGSPFFNEVLVHELKHVEQARRFPTCKQAQEHYQSSPFHAAEAEVEAFCASLPVAVANGASRTERYVSYIEKVQRASQRNPGEATVSVEWIVRKFRDYCENQLPGYGNNND